MKEVVDAMVALGISRTFSSRDPGLFPCMSTVGVLAVQEAGSVGVVIGGIFVLPSLECLRFHFCIFRVLMKKIIKINQAIIIHPSQKEDIRQIRQISP